MKIESLLLPLVSLLVLTYSTTAQQLNYQEDTAYRDDKFPFSMFYPKDWIKVTPSHTQTRLKVVSTEGQGYTDFNINVIYVKALETTSPANHVKFLVSRPDLINSMIKTGNPNARVLSRGATYLNNRDSFFIKSEGTFRNLDEAVDMVLYQLISLYEGNVYTLTFRAAKEDFDKDFPTFKAMAASFTIRPTRLATNSALPPIVQPTSDSRFVKLRLPLNVSVEVPKNWWRLDGDFNASIETASEASLNLSGTSLPVAKKVNLFRANSMPKTTYAGIAINATDSELDPVELKNASLAEMRELSALIGSEIKKELASANVDLIEFYGVRREFVGKHPAIVIEYKRSGMQGPVVFQMTRLFLGKKEISLNLSYREFEEALWKPVVQYIRRSFSVAP